MRRRCDDRHEANPTPTPWSRRGEWIVRQGGEAKHLYILTKGQAEVHVAAPDGRPRAVRTLGPGDVVRVWSDNGHMAFTLFKAEVA